MTMPPPGRMPTQTLDRPPETDTAPALDTSPRMPVALGAPPTVDTVQGLTAGGNGAVARALSGGGAGAGGMSLDPMRSTTEDVPDAGVPAAGVPDVATTDAPPDGGDAGAGGAGSGGAGDGGAGGAGGAGGPVAGDRTPAVGGGGAGGTDGGGGARGAGGGPASAGPVPMGTVDASQVHPGASGPPKAPPVVGPAGIDAVLVDDELAEHERWGSAAATVGAAGSAERAGFIAEQVGAGLGEGALTGAAAGLALSIGSRGAARLLARRIPVPIIGSIIGGAIGAMSLMGQVSTEGWAEVTDKLSRFGEGGSGYEVAANTIDAIVTGLDVAGNLLDTVALVAGLVAAVCLLLALPTGGVSMVVGAPAGKIATVASASSAVLGVIKMALQPLVLLFRSLHTFTSEADPRAVQALGGKLASDAGAVGGVLGGFAGTAVGNRAADRLGMPEDPTRATRAEETAAEGGAKAGPAHPEGPTVEAIPGPHAVPVAGGGPDGPRQGTGPPGERPVLPPLEQRLVLTREELAVLAQRRRNPNGTIVDVADNVIAGGPLPGGTVTTTRPLVGLDGKPLRPSGSTGTVLGAGGEVANRSVIINTNEIDPAHVTVIPAAGGGRGQAYEPTIAQLIVPGYMPDPNDAAARPLTRFDAQPTFGEFRAALTQANDPNVPRNMIIDPSNPPPAPELGFGFGRIEDPQGNIVPDQFGNFRGELGQPIRDPVTGQLSWKPESRFDTAPTPRQGYGADPRQPGFGVRTGAAGSWVDHPPWIYGPPPPPDLANAADPVAALDAYRTRAAAEGRAGAEAHARAQAALGPDQIKADRGIPTAWMPPFNREPGQGPTDTNFAESMNVYPTETAPRFGLSSVAGPMPEGNPAPGRPAVYPGGGPQTQLPYGTIRTGDDPAQPLASFPSTPVPAAGGADGMVPAWTRRVNDSFIGTADNAGDAASLGGLVTGGGGGAAAQPRVEPVNPDYERPPGSTEELARMRSEIASLMVSRAQADADAEAARADQAETAQRAQQLMSVSQGVDDLGRRTDEQRGEVASTEQANRQQRNRQEEAGTALGASASRLAGLATLEVLLGAWAAVAAKSGAVVSLVSDDGAAKMFKLSAEAGRFMSQLAQAKMLVSGQNQQQPMQMGRLANDASAIGSEATRTAATGGTVAQSRQQVTALNAQNTQDTAAAVGAERRAQQDSSDADSAANDVQSRHDKLAADLEAWAQRHREQRRQAIAQTRARLEAEGWVVTGESEW
jgi:hypothetical protein